MITYKQYNFCRKIGLPPIPHVERHFAIKTQNIKTQNIKTQNMKTQNIKTQNMKFPNIYPAKVYEGRIIPEEALTPKGQFLAKRSWKNSVEMGEPEAVTLGEILDNPAEFNGGRHNLTLGQASKALMMSGAFVAGLQMLGIASATVSTVATLIYVAKKHFNYQQYLELCALNKMKPLDKHQFESALKILKEEKKFKDLQLKVDYKSKKAGIKNDIRALKSGKKGMDKTAFQEKLDELKEQLKGNKAAYKSALKDSKSSYLAERKAKYGHFYY